MLALERDAEAVGQQQRAGRRVEPAQRARQRREIGAMHAAAIDLARRRDDHAHARGAGQHGVVELLALGDRARLRVVELRERRAHAALQTAVVEQHGSGHERPGERAPPRLVGVRERLQKLTVEDVNAAITRHLSARDLSVVIITKDAAGLKQTLVANAFSPIKYDGEKPQSLLEEDRIIGALKLGVAAEHVTITPIADVFAR